MFHQTQLRFAATTLFVLANFLSMKGNSAMNEYELILSKVNSRLNVASKVIETTKRQLQEDLRHLCPNGSCDDRFINYAKMRKSDPDEQPQDCSDIYKEGHHSDGIYKIWPRSPISNGPLYVYCDMKDGGGWTVIQRRGNFGNAENYFYQDWNAYKIGFGHLLREFWIGNDNLFALTNQRSYQIRFDLGDWDQNFKFATYDEFWIDSELFNYTLHVKGYNGTAGEAFLAHNGQKFTTKDMDNDESLASNCAVRWQGAWWYQNCYKSNLNGIYRKPPNERDGGAVNWNIHAARYSHKDTTMKIRPCNFEI